MTTLLAGLLVVALGGLYLTHYFYIGPPFIYKSTRLGYLARPFTLYKIRTLKSLPTLNHLSTCSSSDPRTSRFGNLLRSSKVDEIPQLFNLLLGQINLVGPRPNVPPELQFYTPAQFSLFSTKPGITDLSSIYLSNLGQIVSAYQSLGDPNIVYRKFVWPIKSYLQLLYLENKNLLLDLQIILLTILCLVNRRYAISLLKPLLVSLDAHPSVIENLGIIPDVKAASSLLIQEPTLSYFYDVPPERQLQPLLSEPTKLLVVVPVKNGEKYFLQSLTSFKRFSNGISPKDCQLLYVYSPSSDSTLELLDRHLESLTNANYIVEPFPGLGIAINTNFVIRHVNAEKICWLGVDDCLETTFKTVSESIDSSDVAFFQYNHIDADSQPIYSSHFQSVNLFVLKNLANYISFPATIFSRKLFVSAGGMIQKHGNDLDLIIKLVSASSCTHSVSRIVLSSFRIHNDSRTTNPAFRIADLISDLRVVYAHGALPVNAYLIRLCYHQIKLGVSNAAATFAHWAHI